MLLGYRPWYVVKQCRIERVADEQDKFTSNKMFMILKFEHRSACLNFDLKMYTLVTLNLILAFLNNVWRHGDFRVEKAYRVTLYVLEVKHSKICTIGRQKNSRSDSRFFLFLAK